MNVPLGLRVPPHDQPPAGAPAEVQAGWARMSRVARERFWRRFVASERPQDVVVPPRQVHGQAKTQAVADAVLASPDADPADVAEALGMTLGAVYSRVRRAVGQGLLPDRQRTRYGVAYRVATGVQQPGHERW